MHWIFYAFAVYIVWILKEESYSYPKANSNEIRVFEEWIHKRGNNNYISYYNSEYWSDANS